MSVPSNHNRRGVPRFKVWVACSVIPKLSDQEFSEHAVLGHVKDLSRNAVSVSLPSHEAYGVDPSTIGNQVQLKLALPLGYVKLSGTLVRYTPDERGNLFVFKISDSENRKTYDEYLDSLQSNRKKI